MTSRNNTPMGPADHFGHNVALSPDGSLAAINGIAAPPATSGWPPNFEIRDTKTGMTLGKWDMGDPLFGSGMNNPIFSRSGRPTARRSSPRSTRST